MLDVGPVRLERVVADLKITARGVVQILADRMDPGHPLVRRDRRIWLVQVTVYLQITGNFYGRRAVGEVVNVLRADDVDLRQSCGRGLGRSFLHRGTGGGGVRTGHNMEWRIPS